MGLAPSLVCGQDDVKGGREIEVQGNPSPRAETVLTLRVKLSVKSQSHRNSIEIVKAT